MRVIGTAGHVDHGKSTLVQHLTGIDPDRLAEEKQRKLTIDLGFAWFDVPSGETVGVVDVPGHRDFIENMLSGVAGIDAALLVIAADEGVMPQTREHLAILDLLGVDNALIVLNKIDLVDDPDWLELVELDVQETLQPTTLADAPILRVSATTGAGIDELLHALTHLLDNLPSRAGYNQPRLPVDRAFTVEGFGTVVTGTLSGGTLQIGDTVELQPGRKQGRIRGLQSYKQDVETALPGSRVAVNISGLDVNEITRGDVLAYPGQLDLTRLIDVSFRYLPDAERLLQHNTEVKFFSGASEVMAHVRLLDAEALMPGEESWLQLRLRDPLPLTGRDRFILRYPSPPQTIGGGLVVDPHPGTRHKRFQADVIESLEVRLEGTPAERIVQAAQSPLNIPALQKLTGYSDDDMQQALQTALADETLIALPDETYLAAERYHQIAQQALDRIQTYHQKQPLRSGMPREELRRTLDIGNALLNVLLTQSDLIAEDDTVRHPDHHITFSESQQQQIQRLMQQMQKDPFAPPSFSDAADITGENVLYALMARGELVQVQADVIFQPQALDTMTERVLTLIDAQGATDAKQVRDALGSSRKYAIALLEYLDSQRITKRVGDERVRGSRAPA